MNDLQTKVNVWVSQYEEGYWSDERIIAQMMEECSEVFDHLFAQERASRYSRQLVVIRSVLETIRRENKKKKPPKRASKTPDTLASELADWCFSVVCFANKHKIQLGELDPPRKGFGKTIDELFVDAIVQMGFIAQTSLLREQKEADETSYVLRATAALGEVIERSVGAGGQTRSWSSFLSREVTCLAELLRHIASVSGVKLDEALTTMIDQKLYGRDKDRFEKKKSGVK